MNKNTPPRFVPLHLLVSVLISGAVRQSFPRDPIEFIFDAPKSIYSDARMTEMELAHGIGVRGGYNPYIDQSLWAIKREAGGPLRFYYRSMLHQSYHEGFIRDRSFFGNVVSSTLYFREYTNSSKNPMRNRTTGVRWPTGIKGHAGAPYDQVEFIPNVYAVSPRELLGFVHVERHPYTTLIDFKKSSRIVDRCYSVGIAWSGDSGCTWTYCGDIVLPFWDGIDDVITLPNGKKHTVFSNIGGIPYTITEYSGSGQMLNVYFNETPRREQYHYPAIARAPLDSVLYHARRGRVVNDHWKKRAFGGWTGALHGLAGPLLDAESPYRLFDMHSDATFCRETGTYLMTVNSFDLTLYPDSITYSLRLYSSVNGIDWKLETTLDHSSAYQPMYSSFISESKGATIDDHEVGGEFNILYIRRPVGRDSETDLYSITVHASRKRSSGLAEKK